MLGGTHVPKSLLVSMAFAARAPKLFVQPYAGKLHLC